MAPDEASAVHVEVVYAAAPHDVRSVALDLSEGALLSDAVRASGLLSGLSAEAADALQAGIWGKAAALDTRLRDGDRVELTRGLLVDPKEARRQRYRRDGVRKNKPGLKTRGNPTR
jgi:putative ubiquitin-RnfH superfamily antitoxin RatB of RatAB toxin-antitoxin module